MPWQKLRPRIDRCMLLRGAIRLKGARGMSDSPSTSSIHGQFSTILGRGVKQLRKTNDRPPRVSVIDTICAITDKDGRHAAEALRDLISKYPEVDGNIVHFKFKGRGQRETPITDARGIIEVIMLLPGQQASRVRCQAAALLCRWLGGDLSLVNEICRNRGFQEELAVQSPDDPRRLFGEAVEAASHMGEEQLARVCTAIVTRTAPAILEQVTAHIDERLARLSYQRVNLNVRAPKRAAAPNQPIARDIAHAGRPYPVSKFLDQKEREDSSWSSVRKNYAPSFGMQVQILKKRKLKAEGAQGIYVEQNHRPQLLYTEQDRPLMEEAWELTSAHREDLCGVRQSNLRALPAASSRASVVDMLRRGV